MQGNTLPIAFNTINVNAALRDGRAQLDWLIRLVNNGQLDGNVQITDPQQRRELGGNVNIRNISLAMINPALMQGESIKGLLNSDLRLAAQCSSRSFLGNWV